MPTFRVTLGFKQPTDSWRINWYQEGTDARTIFEFHKNALTPFANMLHSVGSIVRISVQHVLTNPPAGAPVLPAFSRRVAYPGGGPGDANLHAALHTPDVAGVAAVLQVSGANGRKRRIHWRGMPDWMVVREINSGLDAPHETLKQRIGALSTHMASVVNAQIRYEDPTVAGTPTEKQQVFSLAPQPNSNNLRVLVTTMDPHHDIVQGCRVRFGGSSLVDGTDGIWMRGSFVVLRVIGVDQFVVGTKYVSSAATVTPPDLYVRRQSWSMTNFLHQPTIPAIDFVEFRTRDTGDTVNRRRTKAGRRRRV